MLKYVHDGEKKEKVSGARRINTKKLIDQQHKEEYPRAFESKKTGWDKLSNFEQMWQHVK